MSLMKRMRQRYDEYTKEIPHETIGRMVGNHIVGWMRDKIPGEGDYTMFVNEQPCGGFAFEFLDFVPEDPENYKKIYITLEEPKELSPEIEYKVDLVRKMAAGEVFTSLGPAERSALKHVLELMDEARSK